MKRPFALIAAVSLAVSFAILYFKISGLILSLCITILSALVFFIFAKSQRKNTNVFIVIPFCLVLLFVSCFLMLEFNYGAKSRLADTTTTLTATVISEPDTSSGYNYCHFKGKHPETGLNIRFAAIISAEDIDIGDKVNVTVDFKALDPAYENHNLSDGIFTEANIRSVNSVSHDAAPVYTLFGNLRNFIKNVVFSNSKGDPAAILVALVTGNRDSISNELYSATTATGVTHFLVVSGLHLSIISAAISLSFKKLRLGKRIAVFAVFGAICIMVVVCNFHSSAMRSAVMGLLTLLAPLINRRADSLNSLGFAISAMIITNPFLAGNAAFLLSVFATFGVIHLSPALLYIVKDLFLGDNPKKPLLKALSIFIVSLSALVTIFPISVYYFGCVSLLSPIVTILISFAVEAALILTLIAVAISGIPLGSFIATPIIFVAALFSKFIIFVITLFAKLDFAVLTINPAYANIFVLLSAIFIAAIRFIYEKKLKERKMQDASI